MARMLARTDPHPQSRRHRGECRCDKSALYFAPKGTWKIRKRNRARERRDWKRAARPATAPDDAADHRPRTDTDQAR